MKKASLKIKLAFFCDLDRIQTYNLLSRNQVLWCWFIICLLLNPSVITMYSTNVVLIVNIYLFVYYVYFSANNLQMIIFVKIQGDE